MGEFFDDLKTALEQAIAIEKGEIPVIEIRGMPAKTYRAADIGNIEAEKDSQRGEEDAQIHTIDGSGDVAYVRMFSEPDYHREHR